MSEEKGTQPPQPPQPEEKKNIRQKLQDLKGSANKKMGALTQGYDDMKSKANAKMKRLKKGYKTLRAEQPIVRRIIDSIVLLFILAFLLIIAYIAYKLYNNYPRPLLLGHSHDIEFEMKQNVRLIVQHLHHLKKFFDVSNSGGRLKSLVQDLFDLGIVPNEEDEEFTPFNAPYIYFNYMFKRALSESESELNSNIKKRESGEEEDWNRWKLMELNLITRLSGLETLTIEEKEENIYTESGTEVRKSVASHIRHKVRAITQLERYFGEADCAYKSMGFDKNKRRCDKQYKWCKTKSGYAKPLKDPRAEMARLHLSLLIYRYSPNIERMYDFRKSGGLGNFIVYNIFMADYIQFIFHEQIPSIWSNFIERVKYTGAMYANVVGSEPVANYMARLPLTLSGIEGFEDSKVEVFKDSQGLDKKNREQGRKKKKKKKKDVIREEEGEEDEDSYQMVDEDKKVTEHFIDGIVRVIQGLIQLIPNMLKLVMALITAITNPLQIIRIILSLIIGLVLYILYILLIIISPLFYIPAFLYVLAFSILSSIAWIALFVAIAIIFFILWILDYATNGLIFMFMRCENASDAWHQQPNYAFGNIYQRYFVCNYPCGARYFPSGWFCKRTSRFQPSFCPQQLLMNAYVHHELGGGGEHSSLQSAPLFHDFTADVDYISGDDEYKKSVLTSFYGMQKRFSKTCDENLSENNFITSYMCKNLDQVMSKENVTKEELEKLRLACYKCYCKHFYLKSGCRMSQRPYLKVLMMAPSEKISSKYLYQIDQGQTDAILERLEQDLALASEPSVKKQITQAVQKLQDGMSEKKEIHIVNDGFDNDPSLKKKSVYDQIVHLPNAGKRFKFCDSFYDQEEPQLAFGRRKSGQILYYVLYAFLLLIIISFGFIILYQSVDMTREE